MLLQSPEGHFYTYMTRNPVTRRRFLLSATGVMLAASQVRSRAGASKEALGRPLSTAFNNVNKKRFDLSQPYFQLRERGFPQIDLSTWKLQLSGLVQEPLSLSLDELKALTSVEFPCTIACATHSRDNTLIGHASWQGISAREILNWVDVLHDAQFVQFRTADGYRTFLSIEQFKQAALVYAMNGETLSPEYGYPISLIVPGLYSYKMPRWIEEIKFVATAQSGTWEDRGWSVEGKVQTTSSIDVPYHMQEISGNLMISGMAFAGDREIVQVEVSIDDGAWMPVLFKSRGPNSLADWLIEWVPPAPGDYLIKVRATDNTGFVQGETTVNTFPLGSSQVHQVVVRVLATNKVV